MKTLIFVIIALILLGFLGGCIHRNIEDRCARAGLDIQELSIEETYTGDQKARVYCTKAGE
jgi:hypothetical protein